MSKILYLQAQAQVGLLALSCAVKVQAEKSEWDRKNPWVSRSSNGQFGGGGKSSAEKVQDAVGDAAAETVKAVGDSYEKAIGAMGDAIEKTQKLFDTLDDKARTEAAKAMDAIGVKEMHESIGKAFDEVSKESGELYKDIIKKVGDTLNPKNILSRITDTVEHFTKHPERAFIGITKNYALWVGTVATIACVGAAGTASAVGVATLAGGITSEAALTANTALTSVLAKEGLKANTLFWIKECIETLEESFEKSVTEKDKKEEVKKLTKKLQQANEKIELSMLRLERASRKAGFLA